MRVLGVSGSLRRDSHNTKLLRAAGEIVEQHGGELEVFGGLKAIPPYWAPYLAMLQEMVGDMEKDRELLEAASPVNNADKIKAPLLIAQGAKDPRVVKSESDQMVEAMRKRGVEVEYIVKDNEGHGFTKKANEIRANKAVLEFLDKHLKNGGAVSSKQ